ncbi:hypothetical protein, partial [Mesorhizobium sp.]|uniref:hypothetical protein n=1 Tax=Mesorhizobium sp. TaxID=1871066 RepID=UPI0025FD600A
METDIGHSLLRIAARRAAYRLGCVSSGGALRWSFVLAAIRRKINRKLNLTSCAISASPGQSIEDARPGPLSLVE